MKLNKDKWTCAVCLLILIPNDWALYLLSNLLLWRVVATGCPCCDIQWYEESFGCFIEWVCHAYSHGLTRHHSSYSKWPIHSVLYTFSNNAAFTPHSSHNLFPPWLLYHFSTMQLTVGSLASRWNWCEIPGTRVSNFHVFQKSMKAHFFNSRVSLHRSPLKSRDGLRATWQCQSSWCSKKWISHSWMCVTDIAGEGPMNNCVLKWSEWNMAGAYWSGKMKPVLKCREVHLFLVWPFDVRLDTNAPIPFRDDRFLIGADSVRSSLIQFLTWMKDRETCGTTSVLFLF